MSNKKTIEWQLWLHTMIPSAASLTISFMIAVIILGFHLLLIANDPELVVGQLTGIENDDRLISFYLDAIKQPLDNIFGSSTLGVLSTVMVWGLVGWLLYGASEYLMTNLKELKYTSEEINKPMKNKIVQHPLRRQLIIRNLWRFFIGVLFVLYSVSIRPFVVELFYQDVQLFTSATAEEMLLHLSIVLVGWIVVFHIYVLLLRMFVLRTRFFGEIIY